MLGISVHIRMIITSLIYLIGLLGTAFSTYLNLAIALISIIFVGGSSSLGERYTSLNLPYDLFYFISQVSLLVLSLNILLHLSVVFLRAPVVQGSLELVSAFCSNMLIWNFVIAFSS